MCGEGEASDKGTFANEGVNLSLGSLQLHPSSATNSLCDAGCATEPLQSCVYRRDNGSPSHGECEDGSVTNTASEISCRWGRVTSGGKKHRALACPRIAAALQQLLTEASSRAWCRPPALSLRDAQTGSTAPQLRARGSQGVYFCSAVVDRLFLGHCCFFLNSTEHIMLSRV